jgi:protein-S-isoprenylcysteine O-methyltransferase Ste14
MPRTIMPTTWLLLALIAMLALHLLVPVARIVPRPWQLLGLGPLLVGVAMNLVADRAFHAVHTSVKPLEASSILVTDGVFRLTRNPMYVGFVLVLLGVAALLRSVTPFAVVVAFAVLMDRGFVAVEERMLAQRFGAEWERYRRRTRRWL